MHPSWGMVRPSFLLLEWNGLPICKVPKVYPIPMCLALQTHQIEPTCLQHLQIFLITIWSLPDGYLSRLPISLILTWGVVRPSPLLLEWNGLPICKVPKVYPMCLALQTYQIEPSCLQHLRIFLITIWSPPDGHLSRLPISLILTRALTRWECVMQVSFLHLWFRSRAKLLIVC